MTKYLFNKTGKFGIFHGIEGVADVKEGDECLGYSNQAIKIWLDNGVVIPAENKVDKVKAEVEEPAEPAKGEVQEVLPVEEQAPAPSPILADKPKKRGRKRKGK